ncbi:hypothetical protein RKLH11_373 [Rhodobacteraceae bacterium KLH11]|nr:hypothetical protein RKLH11_373 [Rhodobacteraceae bacterium KLH11]
MKSFSSTQYWTERYKRGKTSGAGSYGRLSVYKANFINVFVESEGIQSVVELGSGDGNQASLFDIPKYTGLDISEVCIERCNSAFKDRTNWSFSLPDAPIEAHDLAISLDVIYHLVEEDVFATYINRLFDIAKKYVLIYSSDFDEVTGNRHVRHRKYSRWVAENKKGWRVCLSEDNPFSYEGHGNSPRNSFAAFTVFEKVDA